MKRVIAFLGLAGLFLRGRAQTFAEWFEQKKTQIRYLKEQIAALRVYDQQVQQGYEIAYAGLGSIALTKQEDLEMHSGYFASLTKVNPAFRTNPRVGETFTRMALIVDVAGKIQAAGNAKPEIKKNTDAVLEYIMGEFVENLRLLRMLLTDGEWELKDEQRLQQLDLVYVNVMILYEEALKAWGEINYSLKNS